MSGADDYEHALGGLRGHIVYGEQTAGDTPVAWVQVKVALPYLRNAERVLVAERARAEAAEAECVRLRAIVEGREHPPTPDEAEAHYRAGGGWLYARAEGCRASVAAVPMTVRSIACAADYQRETLRWWPLDATGRPCPWPTPALGATGEGR